jgi:hypothetical protein
MQVTTVPNLGKQLTRTSTARGAAVLKEKHPHLVLVAVNLLFLFYAIQNVRPQLNSDEYVHVFLLRV